MQSNLVVEGLLEPKFKDLSIRNVESLFSRVVLTGLDEAVQVEGLLENYRFQKRALPYVAPYIHAYLDQLGVSDAPVAVSSLGKNPMNSSSFWTHYYDPVDKLLAMGLALDELSFESSDTSLRDNPNKCYIIRK